MPKITIDGKEYDVAAGKTVLQACLDAGVFIPHYCYHPKLSISGNCRMCLVEIEGRAKLEISCNLQASDGMKIRTNSEAVTIAQKGVLEFILINHPLDCPICDQAGECKLQDYYFQFSSVPSRFQEDKDHKPKAKLLGERITLDDERCILCSRCVRFCDEIAGDNEICIVNRGDHATVTTFNDQPLKNPYSLNTVDICPVGALTSTDFRFNKRVWFLQKTQSICTGCSTGCNITVDHEGGVVYRYRPRENESVNQCWMCDEGRVTYKYINDGSRILSPQAKNGSGFQRTTWEDAWNRVRMLLQSYTTDQRAVLLSAQLSNEELSAWNTLVGTLWTGAKRSSTGRTVQNPTQDNFLRRADKNPNTFLIRKLGVASGVPSCKLLFIIGEASVADLATIARQKPEVLVVIASNDLNQFPFADLVLPLATFVEQDGSFTNYQGRVQRFHRAFPPRGESKPAWEIASQIAPLEGGSLSVTAKDCFTLLTKTVAGYQGLSWDELGDGGVSIEM